MHAASDGFFETAPDTSGSFDQPERPQTPVWMQPPRDILPGRLVLDEVVHRDASTVVLAREARRYPDGLDVRIQWVRRRRDESERDWNAWIHQRFAYPGEPEREDLHVGFRLADGTRVLPLDVRRAWMPGAEHSAPTLMVGRGGGGGGTDWYEGRLNAWLWTEEFPSDDLDVVLEWLEVGMKETTLRLPAAMIESIPPWQPMWE
jgi:hypothetical protein